MGKEVNKLDELAHYELPQEFRNWDEVYTELLSITPKKAAKYGINKKQLYRLQKKIRRKIPLYIAAKTKECLRRLMFDN
ncbi:MAG: hypothetical protein AABY04_02940 [Candidatus Micrarchaeota archaeon]